MILCSCPDVIKFTEIVGVESVPVTRIDSIGMKADLGEGNAVLIVLSEMEVSREPGFDAGILSHDFNKFSGRSAT